MRDFFLFSADVCKPLLTFIRYFHSHIIHQKCGIVFCQCFHSSSQRGFCAECQARLSPQAVELTTMWCCVDWWNAWRSDHCVVLWRLMECMMIWPPCGNVLTGGMHDDLVFGSIATLQLLQKHGSQSLGFLCQILIVTLWFTQVLRWFA